MLENNDIPKSLTKFSEQVSNLLSTQADEAIFLPKIGEAMRELVSQDDWLDPKFTVPHPEYYHQYLLYAAPQDQFSVVSFVWGPGQSTPIHDHTVWGVIGVLRGAELVQNFDQKSTGDRLTANTETKLESGDIGFVSPTIGDIHRVKNAYDDRVSISIHAYGANIGKTRRHVFPSESGETKEFISGYANKDE